ncbi:formin-like protein 5 [Penaeus chinensis]|uniref:formin-like protein 5 n=1 Tax=Penaeus chinensis TaxID=139456 RepID=UPI001FB62441|nr:formin-like protein 5 [Penaeus chinensis]
MEKGHEVYILQESRQFTGVGRPTSLLPPNTTRRRRLTTTRHNRTRVFSSDLPAFGKGSAPTVFGRSPQEPKRSSTKHKSLSELLLQEETVARHERKSPITFAPPVYKPGPAVVKFAPDLGDLRKAGLVGQLDMKKVTKGKTIEDGEISERIQKQGRKRNSETETKIPDYVSSTTFKPKFVYKDVGTQNKKISTFDGVSEEMALYVETAHSPTYSLLPQALRKHRLRQYNLSSQGRDPATGIDTASLRRQQFLSQRLSPTASSFIPPATPLSDRSVVPRGNWQSPRPLVIVATPRPTLTPKTYILDSTTPKPRSSTRLLKTLNVRARERIDLPFSSPASSPFYEAAGLSPPPFSSFPTPPPSDNPPQPRPPPTPPNSTPLRVYDAPRFAHSLRAPFVPAITPVPLFPTGSPLPLTPTGAPLPLVPTSIPVRRPLPVVPTRTPIPSPVSPGLVYERPVYASTPLPPRRPTFYESVGGIPGVPGTPHKDFPMYATIPDTTFSCNDRITGYYADTEARCQKITPNWPNTSAL